MIGGGKSADRRAANDVAREAYVAPLLVSPAAEPPVLPEAVPNQPMRRFHFPAHGRLIAPAMAVALLCGFAAARALPGRAVLLPVLAAVLLAELAPAVMRLERDPCRDARQRYGLVIIAIALPMLLYATAAAVWGHENGDSLSSGEVGMAALVASCAAILLSRRPWTMLAAMAAAWLPLVVAADRFDAWLSFACGSAGACILVARQTRIDRAEIESRRDHERAQARALDILVDYEKSGQGWFWETDEAGAITYLSPRLGGMFGCSVELLHGLPFIDLFVPDAATQEGAVTAFVHHFEGRSAFQDMAVRLAADNEDRWWSLSGTPIHDRLGLCTGFRGFGTDHTEKRRSFERTSRLAHYDSLTGVANRLQMSQALETVLNAQAEEHRRCSILLIDLDRFKQVNDTLGHPAGDAVLKQVAERLRAVVGGLGRVGRLGGDEFQVIVAGQHCRDAVAGLARSIVASLTEPYALDGQRAVIGASIGIALAPDDGVTSEALVRNADLALYAAKDAGRGRLRFYSPDLHSDAEERRELERDLREAIARGGLELWYQPVVHTLSETISGFEALLRWTHPRLGRLSPAKFVPIAEEAGLIAQIGEWALRTACRDLASWPESVRVAVNVSPLQFANPALPAIVTNALASAQVTPSRLELEITESVFLNENGSTEAMFAALKRIGVRLALDDFGTGYSSLGYLETAPFDRIKLDQSSVRGATTPGSRNGAILASIVGLAEALGMETTAEGVETPGELAMARALGCSHVQGYIYEPPMSLADSIARLAQGLEASVGRSRPAREPRYSVLRKVALEYDGDRYDAMICNVSISGAMIEGPPVVPGTPVAIHLADGEALAATARWCEAGRIGIEFSAPLTFDPHKRGSLALPGTANALEDVEKPASRPGKLAAG
jgi:diguanylate cyclase (GGDEF)-like protein/PAS domain S-box-containing protein